jgi:hypothetical protein
MMVTSSKSKRRVKAGQGGSTSACPGGTGTGTIVEYLSRPGRVTCLGESVDPPSLPSFPQDTAAAPPSALELARLAAAAGRTPRPAEPEPPPPAAAPRPEYWRKIPRRFAALRQAMKSLCEPPRKRPREAKPAEPTA